MAFHDPHLALLIVYCAYMFTPIYIINSYHGNNTKIKIIAVGTVMQCKYGTDRRCTTYLVLRLSRLMAGNDSHTQLHVEFDRKRYRLVTDKWTWAYLRNGNLITMA